MKKTLILLAGYPGTGKSYLCKLILKMENNFCVLSPDEIKEKFWDEVGFDNEVEKQNLIELGWQYYYDNLDRYMQGGVSIISDYPFSNKQKADLKQKTEKYSYQVLTIRLVADLDILFERQKRRDLDDGRHLGHIASIYHKGDIIADRHAADKLLSYDEFIERCKTRGYGTFCLGELIEVDVTDFSKVNYSDILQRIGLFIK